VAAIPKATSRAHIAENARAAALDLDDDAIETLDSIDRRYRRFDPEGSPWTA
jgi:2,5-diketo-D-gluconate reductase B